MEGDSKINGNPSPPQPGKEKEILEQAGKEFVAGNLEKTVEILGELKERANPLFTPCQQYTLKFTGAKTTLGNKLQVHSDLSLHYKQSKLTTGKETYIIDGQFDKKGALPYIRLNTRPEASVSPAKNFVLSNFKMHVTRKTDKISGHYLYIYTNARADITKIQIAAVNVKGSRIYSVPQSGIVDLGGETFLDKINVKLNDKTHGYTVALLDTNKNIVWQENNEKP